MMATGASVESRLKTGLDHGLHTHYGSATARMASHMKTVTIGMYHIHPLLVTAGVQGNCVIGREVCEKVYGRVFDPSCKRRETQWGYLQHPARIGSGVGQLTWRCPPPPGFTFNIC